MADYSTYQYSQPPASSTGSEWLPESVYGQPANTSMHDWIRAFPRPRLNRVVKPRSAGNSPSSAVRRRITVAQSATHGMPSQYQKSSLEAAILATATQNPRPISWHPSSARSRGLSNPVCLSGYPPEDFMISAAQDQPTNGLPTDTMMSYPVSAGPTFSTGYFPPYVDMQESLPLQHQTPSLAMSGSQVEPFYWDTSADTVFSAMDQPASDVWSLDMLSMANNIPPAETACPSYASVPSPGEMSGPSTPDFLPIQNFEGEASSSQKSVGKPDEELVGMGLYSQPSDTLGPVHQETFGKGLKLEETFTPSDDENDDADADAEGDSEEEEDSRVDSTQTQICSQEQPSVEQHSNLPMMKKSSKQALNLLHKSFFFEHDDSDHHAMAAAQSFPSLNQPCMTYGYNWI